MSFVLNDGDILPSSDMFYGPSTFLKSSVTSSKAVTVYLASDFGGSVVRRLDLVNLGGFTITFAIQGGAKMAIPGSGQASTVDLLPNEQIVFSKNDGYDDFVVAQKVQGGSGPGGNIAILDHGAQVLASATAINFTGGTSVSVNGTTANVSADATPSSAMPLMDGIATPGDKPAYSRENHVHPTDITRAADNLVVHLAGAETMTGPKTFSAGAIIPISPVNATDAANMQYVDSKNIIATDGTTSLVQIKSLLAGTNMQFSANSGTGALTINGAPVASSTTTGIVKPDGVTIGIDANGVISSLIKSASYVIVPNQAARLALPKTTNLTIAVQQDTNVVWYLNANLDPSIQANWISGGSTATAVISFNSRTGAVTPVVGDYRAYFQAWQLANPYSAGECVIYTDNQPYYANGPIPASTPFVVGTTGTTWRLLVPTAAVMTGATPSGSGASGLVPAPASGSNNMLLRGDATFGSINAQSWVQANAYNSGDIVYYTDDNLYSANGPIPANTPWAIGTTGATWTLATGAVAATWNIAFGYSQNEVVTGADGNLYKANAAIPPNTAFVVGTSGKTWLLLGQASGGQSITYGFDSGSGSSFNIYGVALTDAKYVSQYAGAVNSIIVRPGATLSNVTMIPFTMNTQTGSITRVGTATSVNSTFNVPMTVGVNLAISPGETVGLFFNNMTLIGAAGSSQVGGKIGTIPTNTAPSAGQTLTLTSNNSAYNFTYIVSIGSLIPTMSGATSTTPGTGGIVPAPPQGSQNYYLAGDATYHSLPNATQNALGMIQLGGDLVAASSTATSPTVGGIQGVPVVSTAPNTSNYLRYNGTAWSPSPLLSADLPAATSSALGAIKMTGDLGGTGTAPLINSIQGTVIAGGSPTTAGQVLRYNGTQAQWSGIQSSDVPPATNAAYGVIRMSGDITGNPFSPSVTGLNGVSVPAASTLTGANQCLTYSASNTAKWGFLSALSATNSPGPTNYMSMDASGNMYVGNQVFLGSSNVATQTYLRTDAGGIYLNGAANAFVQAGPAGINLSAPSGKTVVTSSNFDLNNQYLYAYGASSAYLTGSADKSSIRLASQSNNYWSNVTNAGVVAGYSGVTSVIPGLSQAAFGVVSNPGAGDGMSLVMTSQNNAFDMWLKAQSGSNQVAIGFYTGAGVTVAGAIQCNGSATAYITSSDERLKTDTGLAPAGLDVIKQVKIRNYQFKDDPTRNIDGVFAQELHEVYPGVVSVGSDELNDHGNLKNPWGVDYSKLVPALVKAVQELSAEVDSLKQQLAK